MLKEDFVIQSNVKYILVRSNIDYSEIEFGSVKGVVYFRGFFRVRAIPRPVRTDEDREVAIFLTANEYNVTTLHTLEKRVKSNVGVRDVVFQFANWERQKGRWTRVDGGEKAESTAGVRK